MTHTITTIRRLLESAKDIMHATSLISQMPYEMDRWQQFLIVVRDMGYTPMLINNTTGNKYRIISASYGEQGRSYGLRVMPVDAKSNFDEKMITPNDLRKGDYSPTFDRSSSSEERKAKASMVKMLRKLGHDI